MGDDVDLRPILLVPLVVSFRVDVLALIVADGELGDYHRLQVLAFVDNTGASSLIVCRILDFHALL